MNESTQVVEQRKKENRWSVDSTPDTETLQPCSSR